MKTTINNEQKVYLVKQFDGANYKNVFCNLESIPNVVKQMNAKEPVRFYIHSLLRFHRISKEDLNFLFELNKIDFKLK